MAISQFSEDMNIISKLPDAPTLTAAQLKAKFDEGGLKLKEYINDLLIPALLEALELLEQKIAEGDSTVTSGIPVVSNVLTDTSTKNALSAAQGKKLYSLIQSNDTDISSLNTSVKSLTSQVNAKQKTITSGEGTPSGGSNGDIYLMY